MSLNKYPDVIRNALINGNEWQKPTSGSEVTAMFAVFETTEKKRDGNPDLTSREAEASKLKTRFSATLQTSAQHTPAEWLDSPQLPWSDDDVPEAAKSKVAAVIIAYYAYKHSVRDADDVLWWFLARAIRTDPSVFQLSRSAPGFFNILVLSSVDPDTKKLRWLFRAHAWLADGHRGNPDTRVHPHQQAMRSFLLTGAGRNTGYAVERDVRPEEATHVEYKPGWNFRYLQGWKANRDGAASAGVTSATGGSDTGPLDPSTVYKTGRLMKIASTGTETHRRGEVYSMRPGEYHSSDIPGGETHATVCWFDGTEGKFEPDANPLGPVDGKEMYKMNFGLGGMTVPRLVANIEKWRRSEGCPALDFLDGWVEEYTA